MAHYVENRSNCELYTTGSLDSLLMADSPARAIAQALQRLEFSKFDAVYRNDKGGRPALEPRALCGVWILGMLRGIVYATRLAAVCASDIEFRWLVGDAGVEKSTLSSFFTRHREKLTNLGAQVLTALGQEELLPGENLGVDGTVVRAASSRHSTRTREYVEAQVRQIIEERLSLEAQGGGSCAQDEALERRKQRLERALSRLDAMGLESKEARVTVTEPSARVQRQKDGSFAPGYNIQAVTDLDTGVIVISDPVDAGNDVGQLEPQVSQARAVLREARAEERAVAGVAADGAYHDTMQLVSLEAQAVACYVPEDRNAQRTPPGVSERFRSEAFGYDESSDTMTCPAGQTLARRKMNNEKTAVVYQASARSCGACPNKAECCPKSQGGRSVNRPIYKQTLDTVSARVSSETGRQMKRARSVVCEGTFARLQGLLHWRRCRAWGWEGVQAETAWRHLAHNLMIWTGQWKPLTATAKT